MTSKKSKIRVAPRSGDETEVLTRSRRRCALCAALDYDYEVKEGQIAHIDQNRLNSRATNLAYLCLRHHNLYDAEYRQSKSHTVSELKQYRTELYEALIERRFVAVKSAFHNFWR